jgi:hypothetical protein
MKMLILLKTPACHAIGLAMFLILGNAAEEAGATAAGGADVV